MKLQVVQVRSEIGQTERQRATLRGLGLRGIGSKRVLDDTKAIRGMITKVNHLVEWQQLSE